MSMASHLVMPWQSAFSGKSAIKLRFRRVLFISDLGKRYNVSSSFFVAIFNLVHDVEAIFHIP